MKLTLRKIGNSYGIIVPKVFLGGLQAGDDIEVSFGAPTHLPEKQEKEEKLKTPSMLTSKDMIRDMQMRKGVNLDYDWEKGYKDKEISID